MEAGAEQRHARAPRVLVVGLDAATFDLDPAVGGGRRAADARQRLLREGVHAPLRSTLPALTPPGWTSAATGRNPGKHNVFNFYRGRAGGLQPAPVTPERPPEPARVGHRRTAGPKSVVLRMPLTYPPQESVGVMVSGIMTPKGTEDFVAPASLKRQLEATIPRYRMEVDAENLRAGRPRHASARDAFDLQRVQTEEALYLPAARRLGPLLGDVPHARQAPALLLALHGPHAIPRIRGRDRTHDTIRDFHVAFDQALARYLEAVPPDTNVVLLSDHGSAPLHTYFCVMNWLAENRFLALRGRGRGAPRARGDRRRREGARPRR